PTTLPRGIAPAGRPADGETGRPPVMPLVSRAGAGLSGPRSGAGSPPVTLGPKGPLPGMRGLPEGPGPGGVGDEPRPVYTGRSPPSRIPGGRVVPAPNTGGSTPVAGGVLTSGPLGSAGGAEWAEGTVGAGGRVPVLSIVVFGTSM